VYQEGSSVARAMMQQRRVLDAFKKVFFCWMAKNSGFAAPTLTGE
jgi:hypothetical protein